MAGIDSLVNSRADMFAANPQGLQQRYAMNQDLLDLLALQKLKKDKEAAQRSLQMQMQPESGTVKDQLEGQMMQATKQELASSLAPGLQQQGQAMQAQQMQKAMAGGLPTQPAPNMVGMARGGIVGYAPGGDVQKEKDFIQTFTTPSGERLTRDDLIMMRRADQIPQETMLIDSSGQRLTVSDAIMNPMSRSDEIDMTPEGAARRRAYERIGTERSRPLEESPEEMLARTMGTPGDRDVRSVRTMPEPTEQQPRRSAYDIHQEEKRRGRARIPGTPEAYVALMENPPPMSALEEATRMGLIPPAQAGGASPAQATQSTTPAAGIESLVAPRSAPSSGAVVRAPADRRSAEEAAMQATRYQATDEDLRSILGEDVAPMQRAEPAPAKDPRMSRYEDQLARLEAEEKDKLGSLIDFLLAAGASGGTNLGATLMGGGSGLQAREQRIKDEMARTIQNIETLQLERDKMTQSAEQAAAERASRESMSAADIASREGMNAADIGSRETIAELDRAAAAAIRGATNSSVLTQEQQANLRTVYNSYSGQYELLLEAANDATAGDAQRVAASALAEQVAKTMKDLEAQLYKPTMGGGADLSSGVGGDDEINALVEQYK